MGFKTAAFMFGRNMCECIEDLKMAHFRASGKFREIHFRADFGPNRGPIRAPEMAPIREHTPRKKKRRRSNQGRVRKENKMNQVESKKEIPNA